MYQNNSYNYMGYNYASQQMMHNMSQMNTYNMSMYQLAQQTQYLNQMNNNNYMKNDMKSTFSNQPVTTSIQMSNNYPTNGNVNSANNYNDMNSSNYQSYPSSLISPQA